MTVDGLPLARVTLNVCQICLLGGEGECHVPGCAFWMSAAPDVPLGIVIPEPELRCECGWRGIGNHYHDKRMVIGPDA